MGPVRHFLIYYFLRVFGGYVFSHSEERIERLTYIIVQLPPPKKKKCCSCFENYQPSEMKCFRKTLTCNFVLDVSICSKVKRSYLDRPAPIYRPNQG